MAPTRPFETGRTAEAGFTLTELLVVLAIIGLLIIAAPALLKSAMPGAQSMAAARALADALRLARGQAIAQSTGVTVHFDERRQLYAVGDGPGRALAAHFHFALADPHATRDLLFRPDGSSSGAIVLVGDGTRPHRVKADWLTGRVTVDE